MSASAIAVIPGRPIARWVARAWHRLGWRQVALAAALHWVVAALGPNGGAYLFPGVRTSDPMATFLAGLWLARVLPIVFAAMVADEAYRDGVRPLPAYGLALLAGTVVALLLGAFVALRPGWGGGMARLPSVIKSGQFWFLVCLLQGSLCMAVYAYWRTTQHTLQHVRASESQRMRDRQRLIAARLMALQARVEPKFLFDALTRVGALQAHDPNAADALLADLIALLRAMLPSDTARTSTVKREFALARAWLRVRAQLGATLPVEVLADAGADAGELGPMLVLPMLQMAFEQPAAQALPWRLEASLAAGADDGAPRLRVALAPVATHAVAPAVGTAPVGLERLSDRVAQLHGSAGQCVALGHGSLTGCMLDLPLVLAEVDDQWQPDRDGVAARADLGPTQRPADPHSAAPGG